MGARAPRTRLLQLRDDPRPAPDVHRHQSRARRSSASFRAARIRRCGPRASQATVEIGFEGYAIGGLSVGEPVDVMYDVVGAHRAAAARPTSPAI